MENRKDVSSLYFGGGTPALMLDDLDEIIKKLKKYFVIKGGIAVELHPDDIRESNLKKLKDAGVTMVSIGVQSFDENSLKKLGRRNIGISEKLDMVKKMDFAAVDIDLIFGIPGQTENTLRKDIIKAFESGATQVSTYTFIDFTFADNEYRPLPEKIKKKMLQEIIAVCSELKIERTAVWTFGKKGTEKYSSITRDHFLGFGVSATTLLKTSFKINTFSTEEYSRRINQDLLPTSLTLKFTKRQRALYYLFWSTYTMKIDSQSFKNIIGVSINEMFGL